MENEEEIWKSIKGYEGLYEVSNLGRIKSLDRIVKGREGCKGLPKKSKLCNYTICKQGNCQSVYLSKDNKHPLFRVPYVVLTTFLGIEITSFTFKDGDITNNRLSNLTPNPTFICDKCGKNYTLKRVTSTFTGRCFKCNGQYQSLLSSKKESGIKYRKEYQTKNRAEINKRQQKLRDTIPIFTAKYYLKREGFTDITPDLLEIKRITLATKRILKGQYVNFTPLK